MISANPTSCDFQSSHKWGDYQTQWALGVCNQRNCKIHEEKRKVQRKGEKPCFPVTLSDDPSAKNGEDGTRSSRETKAPDFIKDAIAEPALAIRSSASFSAAALQYDTNVREPLCVTKAIRCSKAQWQKPAMMDLINIRLWHDMLILETRAVFRISDAATSVVWPDWLGWIVAGLHGLYREYGPNRFDP